VLSSVAISVPDSAKPVVKTKERCKFYPSCINDNCAFYHPTLSCKNFPACTFGDTCLYIHPRCKFDVACSNLACNFSHSQAVPSSPLGALPPIGKLIESLLVIGADYSIYLLASSVIPVSNYKSISVAPNNTICKFFQNCTNFPNCKFMHPKICKYGKACANKFDCNFYHFEMSSKSKFRWVSALS